MYTKAGYTRFIPTIFYSVRSFFYVFVGTDFRMDFLRRIFDFWCICLLCVQIFFFEFRPQLLLLFG